jgi:hypothetical protein
LIDQEHSPALPPPFVQVVALPVMPTSVRSRCDRFELRDQSLHPVDDRLVCGGRGGVKPSALQ